MRARDHTPVFWPARPGSVTLARLLNSQLHWCWEATRPCMQGSPVRCKGWEWPESGKGDSWALSPPSRRRTEGARPRRRLGLCTGAVRTQPGAHPGEVLGITGWPPGSAGLWLTSWPGCLLSPQFLGVTGFLKLRDGRFQKHLPTFTRAPGGENPGDQWERLGGGRWPQGSEEELLEEGLPSLPKTSPQIQEGLPWPGPNLSPSSWALPSSSQTPSPRHLHRATLPGDQHHGHSGLGATSSGHAPEGRAPWAGP